MIAPDADPAESHDLPDHPEVDRVLIYPNADPEEPHFEAVPFVHADTFEDGTDRYDELAEFDPTPEYRQAVLDRTDLDAESIKFDRPTLPTGTPTDDDFVVCRRRLRNLTPLSGYVPIN